MFLLKFYFIFQVRTYRCLTKAPGLDGIFLTCTSFMASTTFMYSNGRRQRRGTPLQTRLSDVISKAGTQRTGGKGRFGRRASTTDAPLKCTTTTSHRAAPRNKTLLPMFCLCHVEKGTLNFTEISSENTMVSKVHINSFVLLLQ